MLSALTMFGQKSNVKTIEWSEVPLTWENFEAIPPSESPEHAAVSSTGTTFSWSYSTSQGTTELRFSVHAYFYPKKSWVDSLRKNSALLKHEQLHFDISELYARKLWKALKAYTAMRNIRADLREIHQEIEAERRFLQKQYDQETQHGLDKTAQSKWEKNIQEALKKLEKYKRI